MEKLNISLREFQLDDWKDVHEYAAQECVCRYQPWGPNSEEQTRDFVSKIIEDTTAEPRTRFAFAVTAVDNSKVIGTGEIKITDRINRRGEIAYIINPHYWRNGYGTEVAKLLLQFGFNRLKLHRIYATCDPRNTASSKVLEKVGLKYEGRMRESLFIRDGWRDSLLYGILEDEWNGQN